MISRVKAISFLALAALISLVSACIKTKSLSPIPSITFNTFEKIGTDSAVVSIKFADGDGDIGLDQDEISPPYDSTSIYYNNLYLIYYYKASDGVFRRYYDNLIKDSIQYGYRIPVVTPKGQNKTLEGEIKVGLDAPYFVPGHTIIKFKIYIFDRALNKSNVVESTEITVP